ncbi:MAG: hypothetical protein ACRDRY_09490 [Pseudonocardiaceae bacterium]
MLSTTAVKVTTSAKEATATTARITALKGESYATGIHEVLEQIAGRLRRRVRRRTALTRLLSQAQSALSVAADAAHHAA